MAERTDAEIVELLAAYQRYAFVPTDLVLIVKDTILVQITISITLF
jgi:hypothetical protein